MHLSQIDITYNHVSRTIENVFWEDNRYHEDSYTGLRKHWKALWRYESKKLIPANLYFIWIYQKSNLYTYQPSMFYRKSNNYKRWWKKWRGKQKIITRTQENWVSGTLFCFHWQSCYMCWRCMGLRYFWTDTYRRTPYSSKEIFQSCRKRYFRYTNQMNRTK